MGTEKGLIPVITVNIYGTDTDIKILLTQRMGWFSHKKEHMKSITQIALISWSIDHH